MRKTILLAALVCLGNALLARECRSSQVDSTKQFLLIVRYNANTPPPSQEKMNTIGMHWGAFMSELSKSGKLVIAYRPGTEGMTIAGVEKATTNAVYGDKGTVSSIFVIKATGMEEATGIAKKCPIYEMDGSVEVRAIVNTM